MKKLIGLLFTILFYIFLYPITVLILIFGPIMTISDIFDIFKYNAPQMPLTLTGVCILGFILYLSMRVNSLRWIYKRIPVLLPCLQMGFIALFSLQVGLELANLWADNEVYSKGVAAVLALIAFVAGRAFLSYWYYKYPISYKVHK